MTTNEHKTETAEAVKTQELIRVVQLPVIEAQLRQVKEEWEKLAASNKSLACTDETLAGVKAARADMTKKFKLYEEARASVKKAVLEPYEHFEALYRECITDPYKDADDALKAKIGEVETDMKARCETRLREYYDELCLANGVDFVPYEKLGVTIDMTSARAKTPTKLMGQLAEVVKRIAQDAQAIAQMEDAAEIMAEYTVTLNLAASIDRVKIRKGQIEQARKAQEAREAARKEEEERAKAVREAGAAAIASVAAPTVKKAKQPDKARQFPKKVSFTIYPESAEQFDKLKPVLIALRDTCKREGIHYE